MWQFMAATGRLYDLRADGLIDERNDPFLSTRAAVRHLRDLNEMFGSWELALAAYNSGAGRVQRAIKRSHGVTDFWTLRRFLPRETRNYVPALWAALIVAKDPVTYDLPVFPDSALCQELARLGPHGSGNREPVFAAVDVGPEDARIVGQQHLRLRLRQGDTTLAGIGFHMGHLLPRPEQRLDIAFCPEVDDYQGPRLQLRLVDVRPAGDFGYKKEVHQ